MLIANQATRDEVPSEFSDLAPSEVGHVWQGLVSGRTKIVARGTTAETHYFEIGPNTGASALASRRASGRPSFLVRMLLGEAPKVLQVETRKAASTVATHISDGLQALGLQRRSHRTPLLLVVMAHAVYGKLPLSDVQVVRRSLPTGEGWLVWSSRPELALATQLSPGEMDVLMQLVAERNYSEIARQRRRSARTIANQVASIYSKLELSGRGELLCYLAGMLRTEARPYAVGTATDDAPRRLAAAV